MNNDNPQSSIEIALALNGREFAMLSELELRQYHFFRDHGRKFGITVEVEVLNSCDQIEDELAAASKSQREDIYRRERAQVGIGLAGSPFRWGIGDATTTNEQQNPTGLLGITPERYEDLTQCLKEVASTFADRA